MSGVPVGGVTASSASVCGSASCFDGEVPGGEALSEFEMMRFAWRGNHGRELGR
jgi:hypothetical protein